jgi:hypothetical protein
MKDFIILMFDDAVHKNIAEDDEKWGAYFSRLRASSGFEGGSSVGLGTRFRQGHAETSSATDINGFIRVRAESIAKAKEFLLGNPIYDAGGTIEIRELPRDE